MLLSNLGYQDTSNIKGFQPIAICIVAHYVLPLQDTHYDWRDDENGSWQKNPRDYGIPHCLQQYKD